MKKLLFVFSMFIFFTACQQMESYDEARPAELEIPEDELSFEEAPNED